MRHAELLGELQSLLAEYWASVDRAPDALRPSAEFYIESGEMLLGSLQLNGRAAIDAFFTRRNETEIASGRSTRHCTTNIRLRDVSNDRATVHGLVIAYAGVGNWPLPSQAPSAIGDFTFACVRDAEHGWRLAKVTGTSVFVGAGAAAFAKAAPT